jgi:hypothetical protein
MGPMSCPQGVAWPQRAKARLHLVGAARSASVGYPTQPGTGVAMRLRVEAAMTDVMLLAVRLTCLLLLCVGHPSGIVPQSVTARCKTRRLNLRQEAHFS